jgi:hypothetical protein
MMHKILYLSGNFAGGIMLILSIWIWFKLGVKKAFIDVLSYGSKKKWLADQRLQNKTMPLRKSNSDKITADKSMAYDIVKNNKYIDETVLLENYHGQILNNYSENSDFEIIEEINLIAGGR